MKMIVYCSIMKVDNGIPIIKLASYIEADDIKEGAPDWCTFSNFNSVFEKMVRSVEKIPLTNDQEDYLKRAKGHYINSILKKAKKLGDVKMSIHNHNLVVYAPKSEMEYVKTNVKHHLRQIVPDKLTIKLPENAKPGKLIGKKGMNKNRIVTDLNSMIRDLTGNRHEQVQLNIDDKNNTVTLIVGGKAKYFSSLLIARLKSEIFKTYQDYNIYQVPSNTSESLPYNLKLMRLATKMPPDNISSKDDAILYMAHAAIWSARCAVFGGFVRDWVINGESAKDIDIRLIDSKKTIDHVKSKIIESAGQKQIKYIREEKNGVALKLCFNWNGKDIDIDITSPKNLNEFPPGVDSDVGNLMIVYPGELKRRVEKSGLLPLSKCISHIRKKKFVFFYSFDDPKTRSTAIRRAKKLLSRNWKCISDIPKIEEFKNYSTQIVPKKKYSIKWWEM